MCPLFLLKAPGKTRERGARSGYSAPGLALLVARPGSSGHVLMDTASPISSRGQSTTIATGTVGARCLMLSEHAARRSPKYADGRRMHLQPHSSFGQQLLDITVVSPAPKHAPQPPSSSSRRPLVRVLAAAIDAPLPDQAGQKRRKEDAPSETLSQTPYSDAESSAFPTGGTSGAASSLSSIGKSRRAEKSSAPRNRPYPARPPPPMRRQGSSFSSSKDDQRLGELAEEHGLNAWARIAQILKDEGHGDRTGKQCRER